MGTARPTILVCVYGLLVTLTHSFGPGTESFPGIDRVIDQISQFIQKDLVIALDATLSPITEVQAQLIEFCETRNGNDDPPNDWDPEKSNHGGASAKYHYGWVSAKSAVELKTDEQYCVNPEETCSVIDQLRCCGLNGSFNGATCRAECVEFSTSCCEPFLQCPSGLIEILNFDINGIASGLADALTASLVGSIYDALEDHSLSTTCGCESVGDRFCNWDQNPDSTCESCQNRESVLDCYLDGLPTLGAASCVSYCFVGEPDGDITPVNTAIAEAGVLLAQSLNGLIQVALPEIVPPGLLQGIPDIEDLLDRVVAIPIFQRLLAGIQNVGSELAVADFEQLFRDWVQDLVQDLVAT